MRAQRLVRAQVAAIVVVSVLAALFGMLCLALPAEDRPLLLTLAGIMVVIGGLAVGLTDFGHGRSVRELIETASYLRQSAAERAADLARINAELVRRDADRASLFATMSHELRTPLSSILGLSRALTDKIDGELNAEQDADVRQIHASASGLLGIVNRTLDFAKLEAGHVTLSPEPVQIWPVVEEVAAMIRPLAAARGLDLDSTIQPGLPPVEADEGALHQIFANLIGNAVKFTDVGRIRIRAESSDARVTITVADTGRGIPPEMHEVIFDPFRQVDQGSMGALTGTGLGLAIARRFVQLMDGTIWVESEPGAGSTFYVSLPVTPTREKSRPVVPLSAVSVDVAVVGDPVRCGPLVASLQSRGLSVATGARWMPEHDPTTSVPRLVLFDALLPRGGAWRSIAAHVERAALRDCPVGLVGLGDGAANVVLPPRLDVMLGADLETTLAYRVESQIASSDRRSGICEGRVLVMSGDLAWRHRACLLLEGQGIRALDVSGVESARSLAKRWNVRGLVVDLLLPSPGIVSLLTAIGDDAALSDVPTLVVGPDSLSPRQLLSLRQDAVRWSSARQVSVTELADVVERAVRAKDGPVDSLLAAGGHRWRGH